MQITGVKAYQVDLPLTEGRCSWSNENTVTVFDSTVVAVETDAGITGYGECCPLGPAYLPAYAAGVRAGLAELAPKLLGADPTHLRVLNRRMDAALRGHPYIKAPIRHGFPPGNLTRNKVPEKRSRCDKERLGRVWQPVMGYCRRSEQPLFTSRCWE